VYIPYWNPHDARETHTASSSFEVASSVVVVVLLVAERKRNLWYRLASQVHLVESRSGGTRLCR
jgi:hypothetical protein